MMSPWRWEEWFVPVLWTAGGIIIGLLAERLLLPWLSGLTRKTRWKADDIAVEALRGMLFIWALIGSLAIALAIAPLSERVVKISHNVLFITAVWSVCVVVSRIIAALIGRGMKGQQLPGGSTSIISNLTALVIYLIGALIILQDLGISITPILTALGVGGLAVALALQPTLGNLFSGLQLIASRQINNGDYVKLQSGEEGYVVDISWRNTVLRSLGGNVIVVPNSSLAAAILTNFHLPSKQMSLGVDLSVVLGADLEHVEKLASETSVNVMRSLQPSITDFRPAVRYKSVENGNITFSVGLRVAEFTDQYLLKHEFLKAITAAFARNGIQLPMPRQAVYLHNEGSEHANGTTTDRSQPASMPNR